MQVHFFISYIFILPTYWFTEAGFWRQQPVHIGRIYYPHYYKVLWILLVSNWLSYCPLKVL